MPTKLCPHRGFEVPGHCARCPYHGIVIADAKRSFAEPRRDFPQLSYGILDELEDQMGQQFYSYRQKVKAPLQLWMQNVSDPNHLKTVHPEFQRVFEEQEPYDVRFSSCWTLSSYRLAVRPSVVESYRRVIGKDLTPDFHHVTVFPNISITSFLGVFYSLEQVKAMGEHRCRVMTRFFVSKHYQVPNYLLQAASEANRRILIQDKVLLERWAPTARVTGNWLPGEDRIRVYCELWEKS